MCLKGSSMCSQWHAEAEGEAHADAQSMCPHMPLNRR
jgi:hypothetical protein